MPLSQVGILISEKATGTDTMSASGTRERILCFLTIKAADEH